MKFEQLSYDPATGEGAEWDPTDRTLTLYVRDNGRNDEDNIEGAIRTPGFIASRSTEDDGGGTGDDTDIGNWMQ